MKFSFSFLLLLFLSSTYLFINILGEGCGVRFHRRHCLHRRLNVASYKYEYVIKDYDESKSQQSDDFPHHFLNHDEICHYIIKFFHSLSDKEYAHQMTRLLQFIDQTNNSTNIESSFSLKISDDADDLMWRKYEYDYLISQHSIYFYFPFELRVCGLDNGSLKLFLSLSDVRVFDIYYNNTGGGFFSLSNITYSQFWELYPKCQISRNLLPLSNIKSQILDYRKGNVSLDPSIPFAKSLLSHSKLPQNHTTRQLLSNVTWEYRSSERIWYFGSGYDTLLIWKYYGEKYESPFNKILTQYNGVPIHEIINDWCEKTGLEPHPDVSCKTLYLNNSFGVLCEYVSFFMPFLDESKINIPPEVLHIGYKTSLQSISNNPHSFTTLHQLVTRDFVESPSCQNNNFVSDDFFIAKQLWKRLSSLYFEKLICILFLFAADDLHSFNFVLQYNHKAQNINDSMILRIIDYDLYWNIRGNNFYGLLGKESILIDFPNYMKTFENIPQIINFLDKINISECINLAAKYMNLSLLYSASPLNHMFQVRDLMVETMKQNGNETISEVVKIWHKKLKDRKLYVFVDGYPSKPPSSNIVKMEEFVNDTVVTMEVHPTIHS